MRLLVSLGIGLVSGIIVDILAHASVHTTDAAFWLGVLAFGIVSYVAYHSLPEARFPRR